MAIRRPPPQVPGVEIMNFFDLCIKRPVLATVLSLVVLLLGLIGYQRLSVREYPKIDEPVVSVQTRFGGASSEGNAALRRRGSASAA